MGDPDWHIAAGDHSISSANTETNRVASRQREALGAAIDRYTKIANAPAWPEVGEGADLLIGMRDARVPALRDRLRMTGDFSAEVQADPQFFDTGLRAAVVNYQQRMGLSDTGVVNAKTREQLNQSAESRLRQLRAAAKRWEWLPGELEDEHVWVNIPAATVSLVRSGRVVESMRAVVGHPNRPTPSLRSQITQIALNPSWFVPRSIARRDLLPKQHSDPSYLEARNFLVYDSWEPGAAPIPVQSIDWEAALASRRLPYRFVQQPGPGNSLGRIKLVMDNAHSVYLHDTNAHYLFDLSVRAFSSGCVRLENARGLAEGLVADSDKLEAKLELGLAGNRTRYLKLPQPIPVYLVYLTAWVDEQDRVNFRRDIYARDERLIEAMDARSGSTTVAQRPAETLSL